MTTDDLAADLPMVFYPLKNGILDVWRVESMNVI